MTKSDTFEPHWEQEREKFFAKLDYSKVSTPAYVIHEGALEENLKILKAIKDRTGATMLLALKGYAAWATFPLIRKYLDGICASSANEARLGKEEFGKQVHAYAPAYDDRDIKEHLKYADHIIFNSFSQWKRYKKQVQNSKRHIACGIRINPEIGGSDFDLYNPAAAGSRMGVTIREFKKHERELVGISGLHFHALCEQNANDLEVVLARIEKNFGKYLPTMEWVNFGGGHHITRTDYDREKLVKLINTFKEKYGVKVILEPGEAVALNAGVLVSTVLDIIENVGSIAILDTTAEAHMPDVLNMPYRPSVIGAGRTNEKKFPYRLGGVTCLSGDFIGSYSFDNKLEVGDKIVLQNMAIYTMVKNTTFNGVRLPDIVVMNAKNKIRHVKRFGYTAYKERLS